jgi:secreted trypsin-like serine protease
LIQSGKKEMYVNRLDKKSPWILVGIVSFGSPTCGDGMPAVYIRVESYIDWIKENLLP